MMRKLLLVVLCVWTLLLTAVFTERWVTLNHGQQVFEQMAENVASIRAAEGALKQEKMGEGNIKGASKETAGKQAENPEEVLPEYQELILENPDFAGWVLIEGTKINYPVMQSMDEREYYLHRDFYRQDSFSGTPFAGSGDLQAKEDDLFIYGHHMKNGTMFTDLLKYREKEFWEAHPTVWLDNRYERREYMIFGALYAEEVQWLEKEGMFFGSFQRNREKRLEQLEDFWLYETGVVPDEKAPLLFLVTCGYQKANDRFVVAAFQK